MCEVEYGGECYRVLRITEHADAGLTAIHILLTSDNPQLTTFLRANNKYPLDLFLVENNGRRKEVKFCQCVNENAWGKRAVVTMMGYQV